MKKFWQLVSKKDFFFILAIFIGVIIMSFFESANKVQVVFGSDAVDIAAPRYSMNIPYEMVDSVELVPMPDAGKVTQGNDDMTCRTGSWKNEVWGEYFVCADLDASDCIVARLKDGRIFVFSRKDNASTAQDYETLQSYLAP